MRKYYKYYKYYVLFVLCILCGFFVAMYFYLFPKHKSYFFIQNTNVKVVSYDLDSLGDIQKIRISFRFQKEFVSGEKSKRYLFGGSMDEGLDGMVQQKQNFAIRLYLAKDTTLCLNDYIHADSLQVYYHQRKIAEELYHNQYSFTQLLNDFRNNKAYTEGSRLQNEELFFIFNVPAHIKIKAKDKILMHSQLYKRTIQKDYSIDSLQE